MATDTKMYRCLDGFTFRHSDGMDHSVKTDERLLGTAEAVRKYPDLFCLEGLPDVDVARAKSAHHNKAIDKALKGASK